MSHFYKLPLHVFFKCTSVLFFFHRRFWGIISQFVFTDPENSPISRVLNFIFPASTWNSAHRCTVISGIKLWNSLQYCNISVKQCFLVVETSSWRPFRDISRSTLFSLFQGLSPGSPGCQCLALTPQTRVNPPVGEPGRVNGETGWRDQFYVKLPALKVTWSWERTCRWI